MDSASHGPGGDESKDSKPAVVLSEVLTGPGVQVSEKVAPAAAEALVVQDERKKEGGQAKAQQQKPALKKPDKLAPCPRCDSLDTKFCYYNNYNVNQPRHFCKNCQRYWTAGGTLRNVPVGAGRRKNKHGSLQARHASMPDPVVRLDSVGMAQPRPCLARGQSAPELRPPLHAASSSSTVITSIPNCQERPSSDAVTRTSTIHVENGKRHYIPEPQMSISSDHGGSRSLHAEHGASGDAEVACEAEKDDYAEACTSSAPGSPSQQDTPPTAHEVPSMVRGGPAILQPVCAGVVRPVGIIDGSGLWTAAPAPFGLYNGSWPYGYNVGWSGPPPGTPSTPICPPAGTLVACQPGVGGLTAWSAPPNGLFCWGSTIIPGMPPGMAGPPWMAPGWGGGWSMPWGGPEAAAAAAAAAAASVSASVPVQAAGAPSTAFPSKLPIRPVLSKHPRDRLELERVESSLWVPKMVRLDDPGNLQRSSLWTAVGAAVDSPVTSGSNFKAFLPVVGDGKASVTSGDEKQVRS